MDTPSITLPMNGSAAPCFVVGQDSQGHWLAVETHGMGGGIFVSREAAWRYARSEAGRRREAVSLASRPIASPKTPQRGT